MKSGTVTSILFLFMVDFMKKKTSLKLLPEFHLEMVLQIFA